MTFKIDLHQDGILRKTWLYMPAYKHKNMLRIPDFSYLSPLLAPNIRHALQRSEWKIVCSDTLRADLLDRKGKPIGSLFATWS